MANKAMFSEVEYVRVGHYDFVLKLKPAAQIKCPSESTYNNLGLCDRSDLIIMVAKDQADQHKLHTILHEIYHASLTAAVLPSDEEDCANHFATLVMQIMRDNKWLKDYL